MDLEEALRRIAELEEESARKDERIKSLKAELFNERREKEKALLILNNQKEKKRIAYVRQFVPKTERTKKVIINEAEEIIEKDKIGFCRVLFKGYGRIGLAKMMSLL